MMMLSAATQAAVQRRMSNDSVFEWIVDYLSQRPDGVTGPRLRAAAEWAGIMSYRSDATLRGHCDFTCKVVGEKRRWFLANNPRVAWEPQRA